MSRARTLSRRDRLGVRATTLWRSYRWTLEHAETVLEHQAHVCVHCTEATVTVLDPVHQGAAFICSACAGLVRSLLRDAAARGEYRGVRREVISRPRRDRPAEQEPAAAEAAPRVRVRTGMPLLSRTPPSRA